VFLCPIQCYILCSPALHFASLEIVVPNDLYLRNCKNRKISYFRVFQRILLKLFSFCDFSFKTDFKYNKKYAIKNSNITQNVTQSTCINILKLFFSFFRSVNNSINNCKHSSTKCINRSFNEEVIN
jgi:hypothetical protein